MPQQTCDEKQKARRVQEATDESGFTRISRMNANCFGNSGFAEISAIRVSPFSILIVANKKRRSLRNAFDQ